MSIDNFLTTKLLKLFIEIQIKIVKKNIELLKEKVVVNFSLSTSVTTISIAFKIIVLSRAGQEQLSQLNIKGLFTIYSVKICWPY
jgi:hypothetical protein